MNGKPGSGMPRLSRTSSPRDPPAWAMGTCPSTSSASRASTSSTQRRRTSACQGEEPACALPPIAHLPGTHFQKYSLQTSIYNVELHQTHGIDAGERMYLLRMHTDRKGKHRGGPEYELVQ